MLRWPLLGFYSMVMGLTFFLFGIPAILGLSIMSILYGVVYHPIVYICSLRDNALQGCYMTVLLPYVIVVGIAYGFRDIFVVKLASLWERYNRILQNGVNLINEM